MKALDGDATQSCVDSSKSTLPAVLRTHHRARMAQERLGAGFQVGDPDRLEQAGSRGGVRGLQSLAAF